MASDGPQAVDSKFMDLYSRQIGTFGMETMVKLISLRVCIVGLKGVGTEAAKNLSLAGVHTITLVDGAKPAPGDVGLNFALSEESVASGLTRAQLTAPLIAELNHTVRVTAAAELTEELVSRHDVLVVADSLFPKDDLIKWNNYCRTFQREGYDDLGLRYSKEAPISFIYCFQGGTLGSIFVDHGANFVTRDPDGSQPLVKVITQVQHFEQKGDEPAYSRIRFMTPDGQRPGSLRDNTAIKITDVKGLELNGQSINNVVLRGVVNNADPPNTVRVGSLANRTDYVAGGFITEEKEIVTRTFRSLNQCLLFPPPIVFTNAWMDGSNETKVHLTLATLLEYRQRNGQFPPLHDEAAAAECVQIASEINTVGKKINELSPGAAAQALSVDEIDADFIRDAAKICQAELQPYSAFLGGVVAQEVVKVTGKYTPIEQFLHLHCMEVLATPRPTDTKPEGSRYDNLIAIFGKAFAERLQNLRMFMVGCGALGCEYLKNFALCGICCGPKGDLSVTDNDRIEVSNLNRQFLFREDNVGQAKSVAAGNRVKKMNPRLNVTPRQDFVGPTTEHLFPDTFWMNLDLVCNALDNIQARMFVDAKCVLFEKVLVEAGTMGTAGNVDIIVPHVTTSYSDGGQADETGGIPMCTLRNFPYIFDHCIEWARAQFEDLFVAPIMALTQLEENPDLYAKTVLNEINGKESEGEKRSLISKYLKNLQAVKKTLELLQEKPTIESCFALAWQTIHALFRDKIDDLIRAFPEDATKKNGEKFWSGHKRFPKSMTLDLNNPDHAEFLVAAGNMYACMLGVHGEKPAPRYNDPANPWMAQYRTKEFLKKVTSGLAVPEAVKGAVEDLDEESAKEQTSSAATVDVDDEKQQFDSLLATCVSLVKSKKAKPTVVDFEKDDDQNFHIDFVTATANLRATNYHIETADRHKVKMIAGRIIPAIATTTACVTGLAMVEMFKAMLGKPVEDLRNGMIDLGGNNYVMFERDPPLKIRTRVKKTYYPEQDYTEEQNIVSFPNPHTKYDKIVLDEVTAATTIEEFAAMVAKKTEGLEVDALGVGTATLWNGLPAHANTKRPLLECIEGANVSLKGKLLFDGLAVNLVDENGDEVECAAIVLKFKQ